MTAPSSKNLDWIWNQLDLGNEVPGWAVFEAPEGFDGLRRDDGEEWARLGPNGPWVPYTINS
jgi:hypothetical protein